MAVILPNNGRPRAVISGNPTEAGISTEQIIVEGDAVSLTVYVNSLENGNLLNIKVEEVGDSATNIKPIHTFAQIGTAREVPITAIIPACGLLRITVEYDGELDFEIQGKAVSGSVLVDSNVQNVQLVQTEEERIHNEAMIESQHRIEELLRIIINHQRIITGIETNEEGVL